MDIASFCSCQDLQWRGCYGSGAKYQKYLIPDSVIHPAKMSWNLLERIFKHLESLNLLTTDSVVIDFMAGTGRTNTMAALRRYRTISVELEPHFIEMIAGYDCDGKTISDFKINPCVCKAETLHKPHTIRTGLFEVECSGNPRIVPVCRCGDKIHHRKHHVIGNKELLEQVMGRKVRWDILQGDARELSRLLSESGLVRTWFGSGSGFSSGLLSLQDESEFVGVVSPPYFSQVAYQDKEFIKSIAEDKSQRYRDGRLKGHFATPEAIRRYAEKIMENYSMDPRNIGNLPDQPLAGIVSPPYGDIDVGKGIRPNRWEKIKDIEGFKGRKDWKSGTPSEYSPNPDNIGNLKDVPLVGIMSPPYSDTQQGGGIAIKGYSGPHIHEMGKNQPVKVGERCGYMKKAHGCDPGNIGNLKDVPLVAVISPPYQDTAMPMGCPSHIRKLAREGDWDKAIESERKSEADQAKKGNKYAVSTDETIRKKIEMALEREKGNYSENPDNIGNLPDRPMVGITSPPYGLGSGGLGNDGRQTQVQKDKNIHLHYSQGETNIGNERVKSYLSAMFKVYQQAFLCGISPLVVVTKNPTRNGKLRRLDLDTIFLLQKSGYEIFDYHRAILFETHTQSTLDGDSKDVHKGRISFFKRLSLEKGTTVAQWEDIIFARIPINCARPISELRALNIPGAPDSGGEFVTCPQ